MKAKIGLMLLSVFLVIQFSCTYQEEEYQVVNIKFKDTPESPGKSGEPATLSNFIMTMLLMFNENEEGVISVPLSDKEIVMIYKEDVDIGIIYQYDKRHGTELSFTADTSLVRLNGRTIGVFYLGNQASDELLKTMSDGEIIQLEYLYFYLDTIPSDLAQIDRVAALNPNIGIISADLGLVVALEKFRPKFLYSISDDCSEEAKEKISSCESIESLIVTKAEAADLNKMLRMPRLEQLILWSAECLEEGEVLEVIENPALKRLTINSVAGDFQLRSTNVFSRLRNLEHLAIIGSENTLDLEGLKGLGKLESLCLITDTVSGFDPLKEMSSLKRFTFPISTTQEEFNDFIAGHRDLEWINLINSEAISDISSLPELPDLRFLIISQSKPVLNARSFEGFSHLEYLSMNSVKEDSTLIPQIRSMLPNTIVNQNSGLCLGSGYLVLVIPAFLFMSLLLAGLRKFKT